MASGAIDSLGNTLSGGKVGTVQDDGDLVPVLEVGTECLALQSPPPE